MKCVNGEDANLGPSEKNQLLSKDDLEERKSAPHNTSADTTNFSSASQTTSAQNQPPSTFAPHQPQTNFSQPQTTTNQHQPTTTFNQHLPTTTIFNQQQSTASFHQQTLQVPHPPGRPSVPASARRGTNIAVSKRTRFALQVQKPTGEEEGSLSQSPIGGDINGRNLNPRGRGRGGHARRSRSPGPRGGINNGRQIMHSDSSKEVQHNQDLSLDRAKHGSLPRQDFGVLEGSRVVRGGGRGRAHNPPPVTSSDLSGLSDHPRNAQLRHRFGKNGLPPHSHSQSGGSTDDSGHFDYTQKGKARSLVPDRALTVNHQSGSGLQEDKTSEDQVRPETHQTHNLPPDASAACSPITLEYAEELLLMASNGRCSVLDVSDVPKDCPTGGYVYIYHSPQLPYAWQNADGYKWSEILHQMDLATAKGNKIDYYHFYIELPGSKVSERKRSSPNFRKEAYKMNDYTLVAYIGDHSVVEKREETLRQKREKLLGSMSMHTNLQKEAKSRSSSKICGVKTIPGRSYNTISGSITNKFVSSLPRKPRSQSLERARSPYREGELKHFQLPPSGTLSQKCHYISDPDMLASKLVEQEYLQSLDQAKSATKNDRFVNLWELSSDLSNGKFVKNISIYPSLQVTLVHPDMTREFENICKILYSERCPGDLAEETMKLFYDMTFEIGDMFVTILTFTNYFYIGSPVMPLAVNIHERKFKSSHSLFWARVLCDIPALAKYRFPIVINEAEPAVHLAVKAHAPNLIQFEGWVHRFKDMDRYMRQKGYGAHAVGYFKACVKYLLMSDSRADMQDKFQKEFESIWPRDFVNYFKERVLPKANRLGKWALGEVNIYDESFFNHAGSPQERFHLRCNQFQHWDSLDISKLMEAFYLLFTYYVNESSSGKAGQGAFAIHPDLKSLFCELLPENLPYNSCPPPSEIVEYLKMSEEREKSVNMMAIREKAELYSPPYNFRPSIGEQAVGTQCDEWQMTTEAVLDSIPINYHSSAFNYTSGVNTSSITSILPHTTFSFDRSLDEFGLSTLTKLPPGWLSNGDIPSEDDRSGHVPSPAPGDPNQILLLPLSPQRKLSVIPEIPGFSRPPSLAELAAAKQKANNESDHASLEIIVSGTKEASIFRSDYFDPLCLPPGGLAALEKLHQHSIESSVVTEGHYDASFETEDQGGPNDTSFDIDPHHFVAAEEHTILSNGHYKVSPQEMSMLGYNKFSTSKAVPMTSAVEVSTIHYTNGGKGSHQNEEVPFSTQIPGSSGQNITTNSSEAATASKISKTELTLTTLQGHSIPSEASVMSQRKGTEVNSLSIQSIPSELSLVTEREQVSSGAQIRGSEMNALSIQHPEPGGTMLWKRVRHCVVFGGKLVKQKKEKE